MPGDNMEAVRRTYAEWARGDMTAGVDLFDPQIHFESFMPDASERVVVTGPQAVDGFMREFLAQWRDFRIRGLDFRAVGEDRVFVAGEQTATGRDSGIDVADTICSVWTFRDGRVVCLVFERDRAKALEAAGLEE